MDRVKLKCQTMMNIALQMSRLSGCPKRKVGCVITDDKFMVLSTGYNGPRPGVIHCEVPCQRDYNKISENCPAVHAEINALTLLNGRTPHKLFCTTSPCKRCCTQLVNVGVKEIYYIEQHPETDIDYLEDIGIVCRRL